MIAQVYKCEGVTRHSVAMTRERTKAVVDLCAMTLTNLRQMTLRSKCTTYYDLVINHARPMSLPLRHTKNRRKKDTATHTKSRFPIGWQVGFPSDAKLLIERRDTNCSRSFWWTRNRLCQHVVCAAAVPYNKDHIYSGLCADTLSICGEDARKRRVGLASISSS